MDNNIVEIGHYKSNETLDSNESGVILRVLGVDPDNLDRFLCDDGKSYTGSYISENFTRIAAYRDQQPKIPNRPPMGDLDAPTEIKRVDEVIVPVIAVDKPKSLAERQYDLFPDTKPVVQTTSKVVVEDIETSVLKRLKLSTKGEKNKIRISIPIHIDVDYNVDKLIDSIDTLNLDAMKIARIIIQESLEEDSFKQLFIDEMFKALEKKSIVEKSTELLSPPEPQFSYVDTIEDKPSDVVQKDFYSVVVEEGLNHLADFLKKQ